MSAAMNFRMCAVLAIAVGASALSAFAQAVVTRTTTTTVTRTEFSDGTVSTTEATDTVVAELTPATAPARGKNAGSRQATPDPFTSQGAMGHFTWGADIGSGVDLTSHDMTMMDISGCFGYKGGWMRFAGAGASIISMMNNASRCYPVYAMARTSFSSAHRLCFMEVRAGVSFNSILDYSSSTNFYGSLGVGLTLAHSRKFSSHVILRAIYMPLSPVEADGVGLIDYNLGYAAIGIGCAF